MTESIIQFFEALGVNKAAAQVEFLLTPSTLPFALWETVYVTALGTILAYVIGLPLGVILVTGGEDGIRPLPRWFMKVLNTAVNLLRSVPFLILMVICFPLARLIIGTSVGTTASIVPLTLAASPFVARVVESSLREMDHGTIEAAEAMGCTPFEIVTKVMLPECRPSLISGFTTATITILSYGAMAGAIGGGGLGAMALLRGHGRQERIVLYVSVLLLVLLVQVIQTIGTKLAVKTDRRIRNTNND